MPAQHWQLNPSVSTRLQLSYMSRFTNTSAGGRNMLGGIFPLIAEPMFRRMTIAGASSFLGGVVSYAFIS